jgi:aspartate/methionine/tyrosine aminotransferase
MVLSLRIPLWAGAFPAYHRRMSPSPVFANLGTTVFETMSRLAAQHGAVNLGQGFPDDRGPADVLAEAARALTEESNQYPPMAGLPRLRQAIAEHERRFYGLSFDWQTEVLVTSGATEALAACLLALLQPGDEAVLFQPVYDSYAPIVRSAGATPRLVTLAPPGWSFATADLDRAFGPKTRVVVLNNPLNPAAKVFSLAELDLLAGYIERAGAVAVCDEVYEHIVFRGASHVPLLTRPGMARRALKIGSAGKTFSLTGWKVGMVVGPAELVQVVAKAHQFLTFTTPPNLQHAVAYGLGRPDASFHALAHELERRRDRLRAGLEALGLEVLPADGTYFLNVDFGSVARAEGDMALCLRLVQEAGVAAIPVSAFYETSPVTHLVRLCFAKQDAVVDAALERLGGFLTGTSSRSPAR